MGVWGRLGVDDTVLLPAAHRLLAGALALAQSHQNRTGALLRDRDGVVIPTTVQR